MAGEITTRESLQAICDEYGEDHILGFQFDSDHTERYTTTRHFSMSDVVDYGDTTYIKIPTGVQDKITGKLDKTVFSLYPMQTIHTIYVADKDVDINRVKFNYM